MPQPEQPQSPWTATSDETYFGPAVGPNAWKEGDPEPAEDRAHTDSEDIFKQIVNERRDDPDAAAPDTVTTGEIPRVTESRVAHAETLRHDPHARTVPAPRPHDGDTDACDHCGQEIPPAPVLISRTVTFLGDRINDVVPEGYRRLFIAAPTLIPLFEDHTPGLVMWADEDPENPFRDDDPQVHPVLEPDGTPKTEGDRVLLHRWSINPSAAQVDRLFTRIVALATNFDPEDSDKMEDLASVLSRAGRSHLKFDPPAMIEEYGAVVGVFLSVLADFAGRRWTPPVAKAWRKALEYAAGIMLVTQATTKMSGVGRRRRTI
jgi:hemoglobin-like flavoprotein